MSRPFSYYESCRGLYRTALAQLISDGTLLASRIAPGGVAERLIAPVLKTGRPKGLVSSNLTPSASNFRFSIADFRFVAGKNALLAARKEFPRPQRKRRRRGNVLRYTSAKSQ